MKKLYFLSVVNICLQGMQPDNLVAALRAREMGLVTRTGIMCNSAVRRTAAVVHWGSEKITELREAETGDSFMRVVPPPLPLGETIDSYELTSYMYAIPVVLAGREVTFRNEVLEATVGFFADRARGNAMVVALIEAGARAIPLTIIASLGTDYDLAKAFLDRHLYLRNPALPGLYSPLWKAKTRRVAELLVRHGAPVNIVNEDGQNLLHKVMKPSFEPELVPFYIGEGVPVNAPDAEERTPLAELILDASSRWAFHDVWDEERFRAKVRMLLDSSAETRSLSRQTLEISWDPVRIARAMINEHLSTQQRKRDEID